ncbi:MAG: hypothetical protein AW08_00340 [Candidatus Accumulibacter adjunctus]|uniref:Uncharacterized protein n=1 Tax=Candidatus Accumulibacter adjunctus TaxID=1454001 RepID=A0A011NYW8_9PROT|nr:MAG: hypothetical protein AW08_00340 [Candidatus Accumulibacter adjunctus]
MAQRQPARRHALTVFMTGREGGRSAASRGAGAKSPPSKIVRDRQPAALLRPCPRRQDFGAKAIFDNLNALAAYVATNALLDPGSSDKINRSLEIDKIKRQIGGWLLASSANTRRLEPLLEEIALNLQKFVPNRSQPRKPQPKPHLSHTYKK